MDIKLWAYKNWFHLLLTVTGKGHYGDVFLAKAHLIREGEPETLVIIKSLLSREEYHHQEFCREIEMFSKLNHEHIAKVLGVCCDMEPRFLITEYSDWVGDNCLININDNQV